VCVKCSVSSRSEPGACAVAPGRSAEIRKTDLAAGITVVEVLIAMALLLVVTLAVYGFIDWCRRTYVKQADQAQGQCVGRVALETFAAELRTAGYDPLGVAFDGIPQGSATGLCLLADLDGDGVVGTESENCENITYVFVGPDQEGLHSLYRGVDLNGDGDFEDAGESVHIVASKVVQVDYDGDSTVEPFLAYDVEPPGTTLVRVTFGIRNRHRDTLLKTYPVVKFQSHVALRNMLPD
jgi:hypothetical protein